MGTLYKHTFHYALAILVVTAETGLLILARGRLDIQVISLLYLMPVALCTRLWGLGPGILTAITGFLSLNYFFTPPLFTFTVHQTQDLLALIVFLIIAVVISQLLGHDQNSILNANSREQEATRLFELSIVLAGLQDEISIARTLANKIHETLTAECVEVLLEGVIPILSEETITDRPERMPDMSLPMMTARGSQGKVNIWHKNIELTRQEERLLGAFTSQGALAIERAGLAESEQRAKVLEESDQLKSTLLSLVSHELRSPLATIKASISSLRSEEVEWDSDARPDLLAAIEEETDHLNQLIGNLLQMTRIETGVLNPQRKWNSLPEIVGGVVKRMSQALQSYSVFIDIPQNFPLVFIDYVQIDQVFTNLLSNSVKYAPTGTTIQVRARVQPDQSVWVQVSNQGPHVADDDLKRIFDKFHRVTAADKVTGTGLGLSICKGIIEAHGGRIWAENAPGYFIFNFTLPLSHETSLPIETEES